MKSAGAGGGGGYGDSSSQTRRSTVRVHLSGVLFLIAVITFVSCRNAARSCVKCYNCASSSSGNIFLSEASSSLIPTLNVTLLRLAAVDVNEAERKREVEGLLNVNSFENNGHSTHRSIASWRKYHSLNGVLRSSLTKRNTETIGIHLFPEFHKSLRNWYRNDRYHPGIMSELLNLVKTPIERHSGGGPGFASTSKYPTCAVVGNSGILLKHELGDLIDSHDAVIRLNNAQTQGYHRNVGRKTTISFMNSNILHLCARREACYCHPYGPNVAIVMYMCQPVQFLDHAICNSSHKSALLITDLRFDMLCSMIIKYYSLKMFVEETRRPLEDWGMFHDAKMFHYSSGMQAVMLALGICDQVSMFGFGKSKGASHHYHTNQKMELDLHDYRAEYELYRDILERPQVIPFLADSGFKIPPVVMHS